MGIGAFTAGSDAECPSRLRSSGRGAPKDDIKRDPFGAQDRPFEAQDRPFGAQGLDVWAFGAGLFHCGE